MSLSSRPTQRDSRSIVWETLRALTLPKRFIPILVVCVPLIVAQEYYSLDPFALPLSVLMCLAFVLIAPLSWRILFPEERDIRQTLIRILLYVGIGAGVVSTLGVVVPRAMGMDITFLTHTTSLAVSGALFLVGGWGLARDIALEASLVRQKARTEALEREAAQAQLMALRAHLDPHFLFNTLNAIAEWCREDGETAERAVLQLSSILRSVLQGVKSSTWPLGQELDLIEALFSLHRMRDPTALHVEWDVPEALRSIAVLPMFLLPLAENAVKHGPAAGHRGTIRVAANSTSGVLRVVLENPGPYGGPRPGSDGIPTVVRRLMLAYGNRARFQIHGTDLGTTVEVQFPAEGHDGKVAI